MGLKCIKCWIVHIVGTLLKLCMFATWPGFVLNGASSTLHMACLYLIWVGWVRSLCNMVNLTNLVHWVHIWFYLHYSCLEMLQTSCYYYTNASMSFSIFADRNVWCSQWEFSLFQGGSSFESCLCYNIWFSVFLLWSLQTCVNSSLVVLGMLNHHTGVTQMGDPLGWFAI